MRPLRHALPGGLHEISIRITGEHLLLKPGKPLNDLILGVIGRAQTQQDVQIHAFVVLSNHYHMLVSVPDSQTLSDFQQFVNGNIARKINRLLGRRGSVWERRCRAIPVVGDRFTQMWRLRYIMAHGVKEGLVGRVDDWPGVSSTPWLRDGTVITGVWTSHTDQTNASRLKGYVEIPGQFDTVYELQMTPLPCFANTPQDQWRAAVRALLQEIHDEFDAAREANGTLPLGPERVLGTDPFARVLRSKHGRAPTVLALDPVIRREAIARLRALEAQWREAAAAAWQLLTGGEVTRRKKLPAMYWRALAL